MPVLESRLVITADDQASAVFERVRKAVAELESQIEAIDKIGAAFKGVAESVDPLAAAIGSTQRAIADLNRPLAAAAANIERFERASGGAATNQERLAAQVARANEALTSQGEAAARLGTRPRLGGAGGGGGHAGPLETILPFEGPEVLEKTKQAAEAGATVQEEIARLKAAGATDEEIGKAREDFVAFSKTHSGQLEKDYLAGFRDARVIAPGESFEMAELGARYRTAARNSGVSTSEYDVGNVLRIMDELGLKDMPARFKFLDNFLKAQQAFGSQISTETALSAYRNAKQSIYGWSDEFRDKIFPTLLQSAGQQGGTEMMTALNNYIGHHMQLSELKALAAAGFVKNGDITYDHNKPVLRDGAQLFEADKFKSNILDWAEDFHKEYMQRKGATELGYSDLLAKMPRSMAGLISFLNFNDERIRRDSQSMTKPVGMAAESDAFLSTNPVAGLEALKSAIEQFASAVTQPAMAAAGVGLQSMAAGLQAISAAYSKFAKDNPDAAKAVGIGGLAAGAATGGYLSYKLLTGVGRLLGFGGGEAAAGAGEAAAGIGAAGALGAGGAGAAAAVGAAVVIDQLGPNGPLGKFYQPKTTEIDAADLERSRRARQVWHNGSWVDDPEAARGRALGGLPQDVKVSLDPASKADVSVNVTVNASSELLKAVADAKAASAGNLAAHVGRMDGDAGPNRPGSSGGIGRM